MRVCEYKVFSRRIRKLALKKRFPINAMFELTYRCNFKCIHCYNTDEQRKIKPEDELTTKQVFNILEQLRDLGCFYLGFTGGEIFMRQDILDIICYARRLGFEVTILTNASLIDEDAADKLKKFMLNKVDITIHAMNKEIFDRITQISGSHNRVFKAIDLLYKRNIPLAFKSCGMQENKKEILKINKFARSLNIGFRFVGELWPRQDGSRIPLLHAVSLPEAYNLYRKCHPEMFRKYDEEKVLRRFKKVGRGNAKRVFNCGVGQLDLTINPFGELKTCLEIDYPKYQILKGSLAAGWQQIKNFVDSLKPPENWPCRICNLLEYCSWCPAKGYIRDGNFFSCDSYNRRWAEFIKQIYKKDKTLEWR